MSDSIEVTPPQIDESAANAPGSGGNAGRRVVGKGSVSDAEALDRLAGLVSGDRSPKREVPRIVAIRNLLRAAGRDVPRIHSDLVPWED